MQSLSTKPMYEIRDIKTIKLDELTGDIQTLEFTEPLKHTYVSA